MNSAINENRIIQAEFGLCSVVIMVTVEVLQISKVKQPDGTAAH